MFVCVIKGIQGYRWKSMHCVHGLLQKSDPECIYSYTSHTSKCLMKATSQHFSIKSRNLKQFWNAEHFLKARYASSKALVYEDGQRCVTFAYKTHRNYCLSSENAEYHSHIYTGDDISDNDGAMDAIKKNEGKWKQASVGLHAEKTKKVPHSETRKLVNKHLRHLRGILVCSNDDLTALVAVNPLLWNLEQLKTFNDNLKTVLLFIHVYKTYLYEALINRPNLCTSLMYCDKEELVSIIFRIMNQKTHPKGFRRKFDLVERDLKQYVNEKVSGGDISNLTYLSQMLNVNEEYLKLANASSVIDRLSISKPILLFSKVEYLLWEGLTNTEIAFNLDLLLIATKRLSKGIIDMKAAIGEISIEALFYQSGYAGYAKGGIHKLSLIFGCLRSELSLVEKEFFSNVKIWELYDTFQTLLELGFTQEQIRKSVYILGHHQAVVKKAYDANVANFREEEITPQKQQTLLNLMVYELENGKTYDND